MKTCASVNAAAASWKREFIENAKRAFANGEATKSDPEQPELG